MSLKWFNRTAIGKAACSRACALCTDGPERRLLPRLRPYLPVPRLENETMRPNQQNNKNRSRGRNNNGGRKHVNSLNRSFESNGPDVKVRGNAAHIAEKYLQLARDAQSASDGVMAENYLQHAEHYFRIVAAAQPQPRADQSGQGSDAEDDDDDFPPMNDRFASPEPVNRPAQQPEQQQTQQQQTQGSEAREESQPAEAAASADSAQQPEAGEGRRRERRPRRRTRGGGEGEQATGDAASGPQPEVGELPAFL